MKTIDTKDFSEEKFEEVIDKYACADWKESPDVVLEDIDEMLSEHGLEIEQLDDGGDSHYFRIIKKENDT